MRIAEGPQRTVLAKCRSEILRLSTAGRSILVGCAQSRRAEGQTARAERLIKVA
jgi:hypothetical protein